MSYIPPGWTQERLVAATREELAELPYETLHLIPPLTPYSTEAQNLLFGARIDERARREAIRFKRDPPLTHYKPGVVHPDAEDPDAKVRSVYAFRKNQWLEKERALYLSDPSRPLTGPDRPQKPAERESVDAVVQVVEAGGYDIFGFTIIRMDYRDDGAWETWADAVDESIERAVAGCEGGQRIVDKVYLAISDDREILEGEDLLQASRYHHALLEEDKLELGLQAPMVLVADEQAVDSLLHPTPGVKPWVWAVDLAHDFGTKKYDIPPADFRPDEYPGFFRVTPEAAYTDLWPLLMSTPPTKSRLLLGVSGARVWDPRVDIWEGIV